MKKFKLLSTDFYQIPMALAYILTDKGDETTGFESFYRRPKKEVNTKPFYIFSGKENIDKLMSTVREELEDPEFVETFLGLIMPKVNAEKRKEFEIIVRDFMNNSSKDFEYSVYPEGSILHPFVPAFQFKGPKWIGQLLETPVTNIINGQTGLMTKSFLGENNKTMLDIVNGNSETKEAKAYIQKIKDRAVEFRNSTSKILLDASFRRAPGYWISAEASKIAIDSGWDGTSHVGAFFDKDEITMDNIGGTMAHAFIMSFEVELDAFKAWDRIFPGAPILVDTYDTIEAVKTLIENNIKPESVRIDSGDMRIVCREVRSILDDAGWTSVGIYISGDMTPELLRSFEEEGVPFDKAMAGTKYVNIDEGAEVNGGFVYKVVEYTTKDGRRILPEKKAEGKTNYPGLKLVTFIDNDIIISAENDDFGYSDLDKISTESKVKFIR